MLNFFKKYKKPNFESKNAKNESIKGTKGESGTGENKKTVSEIVESKDGKRNDIASENIEDKDIEAKNIVSEINELFNKKNYDEVILRGKPFLIGNDEDSFKIKNIVALSYFNKTNYEESLPLFEERALKKNDIESLFNFLMSLMLCKKIQEGKEVFNKILKLHKCLLTPLPAAELALPFIRYYYAYGLCDAGYYKEALEQLEILKNIYMQIKITDDTFLYIRGIPFMYNTLDLAEKVFAGIGVNFSNSYYLISLLKNVDKEGKKYIKTHYIKKSLRNDINN